YQIHLLTEKIDLQKKYMFELEKKNKEEIVKKEDKIKEYETENEEATKEIEILANEAHLLHTEMEKYSSSHDKLSKLNTI